MRRAPLTRPPDGAHRYRGAVIDRRVTQVTLVRVYDTAEEPWRVEWTEIRRKKLQQSHKTHFTETAARRHVQGLLAMRASGLSVDAVYSERI